MGVRIAAIFLVLSIHAASSVSTITLSNITSVASTIITQSNNPASSSASSSSSSSSVQEFPSTPPSQGFLSPKPPSSYEVTENVIDVPDDRPKPSIQPTFSLFKPLNFANTNITINKFTKNDTGDQNHEPKKTSITYVHITKETNEGGIKKLFKGIRDYVFGLKRGVIDGLHRHIHKNDKDDEKLPKSVHGDEDEDDDDDFHREFHKHFHSDESLDDYEHGFNHEHEFED